MINYLEVYLSLSAFVGTLGLMWILSELNLSTSSYGVRIAHNERYKRGVTFYLWFHKRETELLELWGKELNEDMTLGFEDFCWSIFEDEFEIRYV